jgi:hypothetical protein
MKTSIILTLLIFFLFTGCEKRYDLNDISSFEFNYTYGNGWTGYFYDLKFNETGVLEIQLRRPLSDSINHSVYSISNSDLIEFKPYLVDFLNSDIKKNYGVGPGQITDQSGIGISLKSNNKLVVTNIYGATESELPESVKHVIGQVSVLQSKYDTLIKINLGLIKVSVLQIPKPR